MILAHIMGLPIEESVLQLAPAGAAPMLLLLFRAELARLGRRLRRRPKQPGPVNSKLSSGGRR